MHDKILTRALQKQLGGIQQTLEALLDRDEGISATQFKELLTHLSVSFGKFKGDTGDPADPVQVAAELRKDADFIASLKGVKGDSIKGDKPVRGKDYFTKADILYFQNTLKSLVRVVEVNNKQTIEKGFNDAYKSILRLIQGKEKAYAKHKDIKQELDAIRQSIKEVVKDTKEISPAKIKEIVKGIEDLKGKNRLDATKLKNLPRPVNYYVSSGIASTEGGSSSITIVKALNDVLNPTQVGDDALLVTPDLPLTVIYVAADGTMLTPDEDYAQVGTNFTVFGRTAASSLFIVCYTK